MQQISSTENIDQEQALVTVVVATYNRPDALALALSSLCRQTMQRWLAWVVGDCCDSRTEAVVRAIADPRVRYVNLPQRCGDQSGPNSIGASLCRTPYLAFLNHDDVLLGDHLQRALAALERSGAEFYLGRSYEAIGFTGEGESAEPVIVPKARAKRSLWQAYADESLFEPVSAWVMQAEAYRRVGDWRDGFDMLRVPIGDWLLRAARARLRIASGEVVTLIRVIQPGRAGAFSYDLPPTLQGIVGRALAVRDAEAGRAWLGGRARSDFGIRFRADKRIWMLASARKVLRLAAAPIFRFAGWDLEVLWWRLRGRKPGHWKRIALKVRTGEGVSARADRAALKHFAHRVAQSYEA